MNHRNQFSKCQGAAVSRSNTRLGCGECGLLHSNVDDDTVLVAQELEAFDGFLCCKIIDKLSGNKNN